MLFSAFKKSIIIFILATALIGCSEEDTAAMRVGTNVWPGYEPAYLAEELGHYKDSNIKLSQFQSASESIRAFRNGAVDVVALTLDEALLLIQDGLYIKIFLVTDISDGGDVIMARSDIKKVTELKGLKVGVESSALGAYVLARALEIHNVPFESVNLVHLTVDESEQAYLDGTVDAVVTFEPYRSRLLREGSFEVFNSREMPNEIVDVMVVRSDYAEENKEKLQSFTKGWFKALDYLNENEINATNIIGRRLGLSQEEAAESFAGLILPDAGTNLELLTKGTPISMNEGAAKLEEVLLRHGLLDGPVPLYGVFSGEFIK